AKNVVRTRLLRTRGRRRSSCRNKTRRSANHMRSGTLWLLLEQVGEALRRLANRLGRSFARLLADTGGALAEVACRAGNSFDGRGHDFVEHLFGQIGGGD